MSDYYYRPSILHVDLEAIKENFQSISKLHPNKTIIAVVKANAYGLGAIQVARFLGEVGAEFFAVSTLDEAIELRMHGIKEKILVLGITPPESIKQASRHRVAITIPSLQWFKEAQQYLDEDDKPVWVHVKLDTGMNRIGIKQTSEYSDVVNEINNSDRFIFEGVFTHFSSADMNDDDTARAYDLFLSIVKSEAQPTYVHCQNSAASLRYDASECNSIRYGISLYGYYPSQFIKSKTHIKLKPAATLETEIVHIKELNEGETISYNRTFEVTEPICVATLPIGYADGIPRHAKGYSVIVNGVKCPIVGTVCMDQMMIQVPSQVQVGMKAILFDQSENSLERFSDYLGTITYELLTSMDRRLPRLYTSNLGIETYNDLLQ